MLAQLRSQQGAGALAWLSMSSALSRARGVAADDDERAVGAVGVTVVFMLLVTVMVEPWHVSGDRCPFRKCRSTRDSPTTVHMFGCTGQRSRGAHSTHDACKHMLQHLLRHHHAPHFDVECKSIFRVPPPGESHPRADVVVWPGGLRLARDPAFRHCGFVIDNTVRAPTSTSLLALAGRN